MSQTEDRSYYEISLTNGQVLVAFSVLLACVLGAFVSGMWVAREALGDDAPGPPATQPAETSEPRESIDFFSRRNAPSPAAAGSDRASSGETEGPGSRQSGAEPGSVPAGVQQVKPLPSERRAEVPPQPAPAGDRTAAPDASTPDDDADGARAEREAPRLASNDGDPGGTARVPATGVDTDRREPVPASAPAAAIGDGFVIQVFSSNDEGQAAALAQRLQGRGYPVFRANETVNGRTMYRVRVGPYPERSTAERQAEQLKREFKLETWVTASG